MSDDMKWNEIYLMLINLPVFMNYINEINHTFKSWEQKLTGSNEVPWFEQEFFPGQPNRGNSSTAMEALPGKPDPAETFHISSSVWPAWHSDELSTCYLSCTGPPAASAFDIYAQLKSTRGYISEKEI